MRAEPAGAYRADIDGLRAVAVLGVLLYHLEHALLPGGFAGVDVFFVISGYLITTVIRRDVEAGPFSMARFYERRIRRLFPALFSVCLATLVAGAFVLFPPDYEKLGAATAATAVFASNVHFWRHGGYFDSPLETNALLHTWSLAVEEQYYILYPLLLPALLRRGHRARLMAVAAALAFLFSVGSLSASPRATFFLLPARAWELLLGATAAVSRRRLAPWLAEAASIAGLGAIVAAFVFYGSHLPFPAQGALLPCLGTLAIIVSGETKATAVSRLLSLRPLVGIGLVSYSLYLVHWPVFVLARHAVLEPPEWALVAAALAAAVLNWRLVEQPFRRPRDRAGMVRAYRFAAAGIAFSAAVGGAIVLGDGWPGRFEPRVLQAAAVADEDPGDDRCSERAPRSRSLRGLCTIGVEADDVQPSFLVWGDSHALALRPAFDAEARRLSVKGYFAARTACPPLLGFNRSPDCRAWARAVVEGLGESPDVRTVVLVARWALNATGTRYKKEPGLPFGEPAEQPRVFADALDRTNTRLHALGVRVVLVTQAPEVGHEVPALLARALMRNTPPDFAPTRAEYDDRQRPVENALARLRPRPAIVRLEDTLCPDATCRVAQDGRPLYRDSHHLSRAGAEAARRALAGILAAPGPQEPGR